VAEQEKQQFDNPTETQGWSHSLARLFGRATRWASSEVDGAQSAAKRAIRREKNGHSKLPLRELFQKLGTVVAARGPDEYDALRSDAEFWSLVDELQARRALAKRRRRARAAAKPKYTKAHAARRPADDSIIDAEIVDDDEVAAKSSTDAASADAASADAASEGGDADPGEKKAADSREKKTRRRKSENEDGEAKAADAAESSEKEGSEAGDADASDAATAEPKEDAAESPAEES